jgi:putative endopeptidase
MKNFKIFHFVLFVVLSITVNAQNNKVKPGDDFYHYVNKTWLDTAKNATLSLKIIEERTHQQLLEVIKDNAQNKQLIKGSPEAKLADLYNSGIDTTVIEKRGLTPLLNIFDRIDKIKNSDEFFNLLAKLHTEGHQHLLGVGVIQDEKNSAYNILSLSQDGLTIMPSSLYTLEGEIFDKIRNNYKQYIQTLFELIGYSTENAKNIANDIYEFDKELASSFKSNHDLTYSSESTYNKMSVYELEKLTPNIRWSTLFKIMNIKTRQVIVETPNFYQNLNALKETKDLEIWKNKLKSRIILNKTKALPFAFRDALAGLRSVFGGEKTHIPRTEDLLDVFNGDLLGKLYVKEYFNEETKIKVEAMCANIKEAFKKRLENNKWLTLETKNKALQKLNSLTFKIGYPKKINTYEGLVVQPNLFFENTSNRRAYSFKLDVNTIDKKADKNVWAGALAQTVNAFYAPSDNAVVLPAGILQEPIFNTNDNEAKLYGSIGYIIAHELTHGFDNSGRKYNDKGNLEDWWTDKDETSFNERCEGIKIQYAKYKVLDSLYINGQQTLSENIADLGGLSIAYDAYKLTRTGKENSKDFDKQFFISFARVWAEKLTEQQLKNLIRNDSHAPAQFRVNGILSNFTPFYDLFNLDKSDKLYKEEKDRISIW